MKKFELRRLWKKFWYFVWEDNSIWSWLFNIVLAFVLIKFVIYPVLGLALGTSFPIVAVVSGSMEHDGSFGDWWSEQGDFYSYYGIEQKEFLSYTFRNGFNVGDIMILKGKKPNDINVGDVIVFKSARPDPIIHRVIKKWEFNGTIYYHTKGDHNPYSIQDSTLDETKIPSDRVIGVAKIRIPWLGWVKIGFVKGLHALGIIRY